MEKKIRNIIGMLEIGVKTDEQAIAELLDLFSVINRRELLVAFNKEMAELHHWFLPADDIMIDEFLSNQ